MIPRINNSWWQSALLSREPALTCDRATELQRGQLCDVVHAALEQPAEDRTHLVITVMACRSRIDWPGIQALSERPDFPALI